MKPNPDGKPVTLVELEGRQGAEDTQITGGHQFSGCCIKTARKHMICRWLRGKGMQRVN